LKNYLTPREQISRAININLFKIQLYKICVSYMSNLQHYEQFIVVYTTIASIICEERMVMGYVRFSFLGALGLSGSLALSVMASPSLATPDTSVSSMMNSADVAQVSSVSELTDVDPNTWAFQSLKSLVERYGCIEGYPSKKYLGNRPLSRYEFAAGLNSCLDKLGEQIAAASNNLATKDDLLALQRLQEEFKSELAALKGRTDALEAKTKELEANQFSTTTKLDGSVVMAITGDSAGGDVTIGGPFGALTGSTFDTAGCKVTTTTTTVVPPGYTVGAGYTNGSTTTTSVITPGSLDTSCPNSPTGGALATSVSGSAANVTFAGRTHLNFRTTFTGKDDLLVRLSGVTGQDASFTFGRGASSDPGSLFFAGTADGSIASRTAVGTNGNATVTFDKVRYVTPLFGDNFRFYVGPRLQLFELIDNNSYASNEEVDFSATSLLKNQLITRTVALPIINGTTGAFVNQDIGFAGPGFGFDWNLSPQFSWRASYIAANGGSSFGFGNGGLTGGSTTLATELEFLLSQTSAIRLQYSRFIRNFQTGVGGDRPLFPSIGGGNFPVFAAGDNLQSDNFGVNAEWAIMPSVAIFGRYGFGSSTLQITGNGVGPNGSNKDTFSFDATTWQLGFSFPDLFAQGNTAGIAVGQPPRSTRTSISGQYFLPNLNNGSETDIEAYYSFRVNDRMTITPDLLFISQPGNISGNPSLFIGTVRAVYSF
jgi:Carbohydrate-selective porin, OprB family/S-layer homology domain